MFNIDELLGRIEQNTDNIADILSYEDRLNNEKISEISNLYDNRQQMLDELKNWYKTDDASEYFKINRNAFDRRIKTITEKDKEQLDNIEKRANDLKSELKKISKQKSLLIYSKES